MVDGEQKPVPTRNMIIERLWELANVAPEQTRASLTSQIEACKQLWKLRQKPALRRLSEIAAIDPSRTKGRRSGQEAAEKLLKSMISAIRVDEKPVN